jgi:hypothetical protein
MLSLFRCSGRISILSPEGVLIRSPAYINGTLRQTASILEKNVSALILRKPILFRKVRTLNEVGEP